MTLDRPSVSSLLLHQSHPSSMSRSHGRSRRSRFYPSLTRCRLHGRNTKGVKIERRTLYVDGSILSTPMWIRTCIRSATSSAPRPPRKPKPRQVLPMEDHYLTILLLPLLLYLFSYRARSSCQR